MAPAATVYIEARIAGSLDQTGEEGPDGRLGDDLDFYETKQTYMGRFKVLRDV
jgi:hypothetical protein